MAILSRYLRAASPPRAGSKTALLRDVLRRCEPAGTRLQSRRVPRRPKAAAARVVLAIKYPDEIAVPNPCQIGKTPEQQIGVPKLYQTDVGTHGHRIS